MANPIGANGSHNRKETYANEILTIARLETNLYDDFSTDYEKDPATGQIMVPTRDKDVTITDYDIKNGIELTVSETDYLPLPIDKNYACNELIDGYEAQAVPDNIRAQRIESAGYSFGKKKEEMAINELMNGTISTDKSDLTESDVYKKIVKEVKNMKKRGMKTSFMRIALSADTEALLLTDEKFSNSAGNLGAELIREGVIGKVAGVVTKPNYYLDDKGIDFAIYDKRFCQKYEVWKKEPTIEDLKDGKHIGASALQGRQVGGLKVTNPLGVQLKINSKSNILVVSYDVNGGTGSIAPTTYKGSAITLPDGTGLTGPVGKTVFKGWATAKSKTTPDVTSPYTPSADTTLYAVWAAE